jgi:hypothetical protein
MAWLMDTAYISEPPKGKSLMLIIIQFEEEISLSQKSTGNFRKNLC